MTDEQFVRRYLRRLQSIRKTIRNMSSITYSEVYFMTLRLDKRIDFIKDELGIRIRKKSKKHDSLSHIFKLTDRDIHYISIDE